MILCAATADDQDLALATIAKDLPKRHYCEIENS